MSGRPRRFRFAEFTVNESTRVLQRGDAEVPLIPRYFDLLVLLIKRRPEAVTREEIFDAVWRDVIVSDGALTQAVRTLRKCLGDPAKTPTFIRTVSRHGYRFIYDDVHEAEVETLQESAPMLAEAKAVLGGAGPRDDDDEMVLREAAETLLQSGDESALKEFDDVARAHLRDARWRVPSHPDVPLRGPSGTWPAIRALLHLRMRDALPLAKRRVLGATLGGATAGIVGGFFGALALLFGPGSRATTSLLVALPLFGGAVGGIGAAGVGAGMAWAEALVRSYRRLALVVLGGAGGGLIGGLAHFVGRYTIEGLFGRDLSPVAGGFEGLVIGAAVGAGYAVATPVPEGGMAAPRGTARVGAAAAAGITCALASLLLAVTGHHLGAMSLDFLSQSFPGSQVSLDPLARLLREPHPGVTTRMAISGLEGLLFGSGVAFGLTTRARSSRRQALQEPKPLQTQT